MKYIFSLILFLFSIIYVNGQNSENNIFEQITLRKSFQSKNDKAESAIVTFSKPKDKAESWLLNAAIGINILPNTAEVLTLSPYIEYHRNSLIDKEQNFATTFSTEDYILFDRTIIDTASDTLINTNNNAEDTRFKSGGLVGIENYIDVDNFSYSNMNQVDSTSGRPLWDGYVTPVGSQLQYVVGGVGAFDIGPYDSDNTQEVNDYIMMERGAKDNNVWSSWSFY